MHDADERRAVQCERDRSNGRNTRHEALEELILGHVKDFGGEHIAVVEDLDNSHTVGERRDVQHVEQRCLGRADTGTGGDNLDVGHDFNRTTGNLRRDTESLEEGGLSGLHTGVTGGDGDVLRSERTGTSGRSNLVRSDDVTDILQVARSEDEADVALDVGEQTLELGVLREDRAEGTADHSVLAHHDDTLATESNTDLVHLVGTDVVDIDHKDGGCWLVNMCILQRKQPDARYLATKSLSLAK